MKYLLSGKTTKQLVPKDLVKKQVLAAGMAWQILHLYPIRHGPVWKKYSGLRGVLLADEVGGGKTFETLSLIAKMFLTIASSSHRRRFRVLIIAAPAIRSKWEWSETGDLEKFIQQAKISSTQKSRLKDLLKSMRIITRKSQWKECFARVPRQGVWLTSMGALPPTQGRKKEAHFRWKFRFPSDVFDLIIADEAHVVKAGGTQSDEALPRLSGSAVRKLYAAVNANRGAKLLLLSATPFHNSVHELIQLLSLVEDHNHEDGVAAITCEGLQSFEKRMKEVSKNPQIVDNGILESLHKGLDTNINLLIRSEQLYVRPRQLRCGSRQNGLDDFLRDLMVRNRKPSLTPRIHLASLDEKARLQYLLLRDLVQKDIDENRMMVSTKLCELVSSPHAFARKEHTLDIKRKRHRDLEKLFAKDLLFEAKKENLISLIEALSPFQGKTVIVVFCRFIPTLEELQKYFLGLKRKGMIHDVFRLDGAVKVVERGPLLDKIQCANKENRTDKPILFVVSQVANEGLDFDQFSNSVVHFDGHYNPAIIDQRNGRVYRGKNTARNVKVNHVILHETYDQRIKFIEEEKRKMKDFYLGDGNLEGLFEEVLSQNHEIKKAALEKLLKFKIDLEPRREQLLPRMKLEV